MDFILKYIDPSVGVLSIFALLALFFGIFLRRLKQPYIIGYILVGIALGHNGLGLIEDSELIHHLGELGIVLLMFFIGMEISLNELVKQWRIAVFGTIVQVLLSVLIVIGIGWYFDWSISLSVVMGFVIALSSSAVIIKILQDKQLIQSALGKNVLSILLTQDVIIVPLLILTSLLGGGESKSVFEVAKMITGGLFLMGLLVYVYYKKNLKVPFEDVVRKDHELQVFVALMHCFAGAILASLFGLSAALGAFIGGVIINAVTCTQWIHDTLHSFRVVFVAIFFISIGLQIDFAFIMEYAPQIFTVLIMVYITNHLINAVVLRFFSPDWKTALMGGALLAQIGELSFLLSSTAFSAGIKTEFGYQFTISLISLTLLISPFWITLTEVILNRGSRTQLAET